ncbi:MAG TPA: hypothetical protein DCR44_07650 [Acholeplasmatales bacterium]|nr:MAG: hypothetical protein A2Y16_02725 [Tenericutes bacterium GWF2_57_13]HAQ57249.1 hypothetical protein [Acholeplasmatales bacterium]
MKKVLGIMLLTVSTFLLVACQPGRTTASGLGFVTFEVYGDDDVLIASETVAFHDGDTLLGLLRETFTVYCADAEGGPDDTCAYVGAYGVYLVAIAGISADAAENEYIAFYVNGVYATAGVDTTAITDGNVYAFKLESY